MPTTDAQKILDLRQELTEHSYRYYVLNSGVIPDAEYDVKFRELIELEKEHPEMADSNSPTLRVGSPIPTGLTPVKHEVRMLSLQNVNSLPETLAFFDSVMGQDVTIEMKIDGLSLHLDYEEGKLVKAITRGDGDEGADVTANARTLRTVPLVLRKPVTLSVRGEAYWRLSSFNVYNDAIDADHRLANPRNGASGSLQLKDSAEVAKRHLDFVAYNVPKGLPDHVHTQEAMLDYLENLGFISTMSLPVTEDMVGLPYLTCALTPEDLVRSITFLDDYRKKLDLDTDGLVIKLSSLAAQRDLGAGTRTPKWASAYKFPPEVKETRLINVLVQVGKTGQVTPVAQLEPVKLGGTVVQRASICNQDELDRLGIDVGDYVKVQRSGEVIPKIIGLARPSPTKADPNKSFQMPRNCPCCSTPLVKEPGLVHLFCPNSGCYDQIFARLVYAVGKDALDIDGCGEVTVRLLMDRARVKSLSDLFAIKDFSCLKSVATRKFKQGLELAKLAPLWRKYSALSIEDLGVETCKKLAANYGLTDIADCSEEVKAAIVRLIGKVATGHLFAYVDSDSGFNELARLADLGFYFPKDKQVEGPLGRNAFCLTGNLVSGRRDDIHALIEQQGGVIKTTVTKNVDYLVQGVGGGNKKAAGVLKHGTQVITEEELYRMMGIPMPSMEKPTGDPDEN